MKVYIDIWSKKESEKYKNLSHLTLTEDDIKEFAVMKFKENCSSDGIVEAEVDRVEV